MPRLVRIVALTALIGPQVWAGAEAGVGQAGAGQLGSQSLQARPAEPSPVVLTASLSAGWIEGVVTDDGSRPVAGAAVTAHGRDLLIVETDSGGRFAVRSVPAGTYLLRVQGRGYSASRREFIQVMPARGTRLDVRLNRVTTMSAPAPEARVIAAGMGPAPAAPGVPDTIEPASPATPERDEAHDHSPAAWRLRHLKRSVLRETQTGLTDPASYEHEILEDADGFDISDWALGLARTASSFLTADSVQGRVQLLTSGAFDQPFEDVPSDMAAGVAYVNLAAPVSTRTSWVVEAATAQGAVSSWFVGGSYATVVADSHALDVHSSYSRQRYAGGNPQAMAAFVDGSRNVGGVRVADRWTISPRALVKVGGQFEYFNYLSEAELFSPTLSVAVSPADRTWLRASMTRQMTAPGADEFVPQAYGSLSLPPQRTFAPLVHGGSFRPQETRHLDLSIDQDVASFVVSVSHFRQDVDDQLVTIFGVEPHDAAGPDLGHYAVANAGGFSALGWGVSVARPIASYMRGSVEYRFSNATWSSTASEDRLVPYAPSAGRGTTERLHDVLTHLDAVVPTTATRVLATYKLNTGYSHVHLGERTPGPDVRFDVQLYQGLPFISTGKARWELVFAVRNLFHDPQKQVESLYDELLVVRPPKRVVGGVTVQF